MARLIPTRRLWWWLSFGVVVALTGAWIPGFERLALPYDVALAVLALVTGRVAARWRAVSVARRADPVLSVGVPNRVRLTLVSSAPVPLLVQVRDEAPVGCTPEGNEFTVRLSPGREVVREYSVTPRHRGDDAFRGTHVRYPAPLGLVTVELSIANSEPVHVYPNVRAAQDFDLLKQKGHLQESGFRMTRRRGLGTEFESLRDYNDDDFRFVDWKSTARRGKLVVKNFEQERNQAVFVCLDLGRHMLGNVEDRTKVDHALDAALMLLHAAERGGDLVGLFAFEASVRAYLPPRKGKAQVAAILRAAYALEANSVQPDYSKAFAYLSTKWKRRALIVVFTDADSEEQAASLAQALTRLRRSHLVFVVRVLDPAVETLLHQQPTSARALYSRAAATWIQSEREAADKTLARSGLYSVEAEPDRLAARLVSAYYRAKQEAVL